MRVRSIIVMLLLSAASAWAGSAFLSWTAPTTNASGTPLTDLAGHRAYYGQASRQYDAVLDVGLATSAVLSDLTPGVEYFFAVTAYDHSGNESAYSEERRKVIPAEEPDDTTPPQVAITHPADGSTVPRKGQVTITAQASDAESGIAQVELYVNGALLCEDLLQPFACPWKVPAAAKKSYTVEALAVNGAGHEAVSPPVVVTAR